MANFSYGNQKIAICVIFVAFFALSGWSRRTEADVQAYIERYRMLALEHELEFHIPACITLAQGLLESDAGLSELAAKYNNHFGIKSFNWRGERACYGDSSRQSCYRVYGTSEDSFLDHARFLHSARYDTLYRLDITDYRAWAEGLRQCGYAEDRAYPQKLITLIERYKLNELTGVAMASVDPQARKKAEKEARRAAEREQKRLEQERRNHEKELAKQRKHEQELAAKRQREQEREQRIEQRHQAEEAKKAEHERQKAEREQERRERAERYAARKAQAEQARHEAAAATAATRRTAHQASRQPTRNTATSNASADNE